jgi:anti-sigma B factor antagonist
MTPAMEIHRARGGEVVIASVSGDVDMVQVPKIQAALTAALSDGGTALIIDLSGVRYFDSTGVRLLFFVQRKLQCGRYQLRLVVPAEGPVRHVLAIVNLDQHIRIHLTVAAALADLVDSGMPDMMEDTGA